ncbi:hypothetical protein AHAS_Ahas02G0163800 [Arachis hypogaea]
MEVEHLDAQCTQMEKTGIIQERIQKHELDGDKENWVEDQDFRVTPTPCREKPRKRTERQVTRWRWKNRDHNTHREDRGRKARVATASKRRNHNQINRKFQRMK